jgi:hypothetical protein
MGGMKDIKVIRVIKLIFLKRLLYLKASPQPLSQGRVT